MSARDQPTPPFNSPYQQAIKSSSLLHSPAYPSPARSDTEPSRYPPDGLGLYNYSQSFQSSGPPTSSVMYPPSPQPTESWTHLTAATSPLLSEAPADSWQTTPYDHQEDRSPNPWAPHHSSHRSSMSSSRELSIFSREGSVQPYTEIKLEGPPEWEADDDSTQRHHPLTVSPDRLTTSIFPYNESYGSSPMPKFEVPAEESYESRDFGSMPYEGRQRSHRGSDSSASASARVRVRRNKTTPANASHSCNVCGKLFQRSYNHKTHMEIHNPSRRKDHICEYDKCGRQFVRRTDLERHMKSVHLRIKNFACGRCDQPFARKDTLRRHEEDGCPKRVQVHSSHRASQRSSMAAQQSSSMPYYHPPRPDVFDPRSPPLFREDSFSDYKL